MASVRGLLNIQSLNELTYEKPPPSTLQPRHLRRDTTYRNMCQQTWATEPAGLQTQMMCVSSPYRLPVSTCSASSGMAPLAAVDLEVISSHAPEVPRNLMVCSIPCRGIQLLGCVEAALQEPC